ncbi:hypothetical protein SAMN05892883_1400 [Jatrophihabitans sp. GAS493]|uniref:cell division protein PerM n=1 Tax=Jatrophihabitans sp. GAS493 TaxID=1907575 RepID=UPI000BB6AB01|nr:DUF6350 family protein [Jatrophihabitans sp. GAS493]SOD71940.1 hypothetical protein SAMN05892883_1400 [Jatrophihabitans sp. GAS493]
MSASSNRPAASEVYPPSIWRVAAGSGLAAASIGAAIAVGIALLCWLPDAAASGRPGSVLKAGVFAFLIAHHGGSLDGVVLAGTRVAFLPLGMLLAVGCLCWRAGTQLGAAVQLETAGQYEAGQYEEQDDAYPEEPADDVGADPRRLSLALLLQIGCYAAVCAALCGYARFGSTYVTMLPTLLGSALVCGFASGASALRYVALPATPRWLAAAARAAAVSVCVYLTAGSLLAVGSLITHASRVMQLSREVGGGLSGAPIALLGALSTPNAVIASSSYLAGPGFTVGHGGSFSPFANSHAVLPAFPLLGVLPTGHSASVTVLALMLSTMIAAGGMATRMLLRAHLPGRRLLLASLVSSVGAGLLMGLLALLGGGGIGAQRLRTVGASAWQVAGVVTGETAVVTLALVGGVELWRWIAGHGRAAETVPVLAPTVSLVKSPRAAVDSVPSPEPLRTPAATREAAAAAAISRRVS